MVGMRVTKGFAVLSMFLIPSIATAQIPGDHNLNGVLDAADLDLQAHAFSNGWDPSYDLNNDGLIDPQDRAMWVHDLKNTWFGDANLDGEFLSGDLVQVFVAGKYETSQPAMWEEGDWNGDMLFGSGDMVLAFIDCGYETCGKPPKPVPEPSALTLLAVGLLGLISVQRRS